jgi:hypothetical protein
MNDSAPAQYADYVAVGFTGTRIGMTRPQMMGVGALLRSLNPFEVHHGDCVGADADFDMLAKLLDIPVVIHPPENPEHRAFCAGGTILPARPYLDRNEDILRATNLLIATPKEYRNPGRGGTWWTIEKAKERYRKVKLVFPDGSTETIPVVSGTA